MASHVVEAKLAKESASGTVTFRDIHALRHLKRPGEMVEVPLCIIGGVNLSVRLYPGGTRDEAKSKEFVGVFLSWTAAPATPCAVSASFERLSKSMAVLHTKFWDLDTDMKWSERDDCGFFDFLNWATIKNKLEDDSITIRVKVSMVKNELDHSVQKVASLDFCKDMTALFKDDSFTDVSLVHAEGETRAHRTILQARSPVFRCMFGTQMKESIEGKVDLSEFSGDAVMALLLYMYGQDLDLSLSRETKQELANLAKKYELPALLDTCSQNQISSLSKETVAGTLLFAHRLDLANVKGAALSFAVRDRDTLALVHDSVEFLEFPLELLRELLGAAAGKTPEANSQKELIAVGSEGS